MRSFLYKRLFLVIYTMYLFSNLSCVFAKPKVLHHNLGDTKKIISNLGSCTHIEMKFYPTTYDFFFYNVSIDDLINKQEIEEINAKDSYIVYEKRVIDQFVNMLKSAMRMKTEGGHLPIKYYVDVNCYNGKEFLGTIQYTEQFNFGEDSKRLFIVGKNYLKINQCFFFHRPSYVWPYIVRDICMKRAKVLAKDVRENSLPPSLTWCDDITKVENNGIFSLVENNGFVCPSAKLCHFAANPNCFDCSPDNTVLLFESKPGWNKLGEYDQFTIENHQPIGGCVILKSGKAKFIRNLEDAQKLNWKGN